MTARNAYLRLRTALGVAIKWRRIRENVVTLVDAPHGPSRPAQELTPEQARQLLQTVTGHWLETLYLVALRLGLRESELVGLLWTDIDFNARTLQVSGQIQRISGKLVRTTPKTEKSMRRLPLDDDLIEALQSHWQNQQEERRFLGMEWHEQGLVFASSRGTPLNTRNLIRSFKLMLARAGIPTSVRFHDLQHTAGSLMLAEGAKLVDVSAVLGHSSPAVTANVYAHSYESGK